MSKDKLNHRNKKKQSREYVELDISQFKDIIKPKYKKNGKKNHYKNGKGEGFKSQENKKNYNNKKRQYT